jgi:hypothetical protein
MEVDKVRPSARFTEITGQTGLYNIQAIDNMPSIMQRGLLSNEKARRMLYLISVTHSNLLLDTILI